jgi:PAS domain S-box-containing protein
MNAPSVTGRERFFQPDEVIVTKTDTGGRITYANDVFLKISGLTEAQALGRPHNLIRHPDMPAAVFRLLWDTLKRGEEIFAYVLNRAVNGDHYWVFAHVTPTFDAKGAVAGYHSNRRVPERAVLTGRIQPLYRAMLEAERAAPSRGAGIEAAMTLLNSALQSEGLDYEAFIFSLQA